MCQIFLKHGPCMCRYKYGCHDTRICKTRIVDIALAIKRVIQDFFVIM